MDMKRYAEGIKTCDWPSVSYYPNTHNEKTDFALIELHKMRDAVKEFVKTNAGENEFEKIMKIYIGYSTHGWHKSTKDTQAYALSMMLHGCKSYLSEVAFKKMLKMLSEIVRDMARESDGVD